MVCLGACLLIVVILGLFVVFELVVWTQPLGLLLDELVVLGGRWLVTDDFVFCIT